MSAQQIDPRLGGSSYDSPSQSHYGDVPPRPPPPPTFSGTPRTDGGVKLDAGVYGAQQSPQPYYHYPSPQTQTPQQSVGHSDVQSTQASPEGQYPAPVDDAGSPEQGEGQNGEDQKRPRACEACRGLKVRCDQDPAHPEIPCKRCAKAGRPCVITQPSRKRQKKADSRVAELEKKLDALTAALHQSQGAQYTTPPQADMRGSSALNPNQPYMP